LLHHFYSARALTTDKHLFYGAFRNNRIEIVAQPKSDFASTPTLETVFDFPGETFAYLDRVYLANFDVSADVRQAYSEIAKQLLRPNLSYDEDMTRTRKQVALQQAVPYVLVRPGDLIISQGERLSRVQVIMLEKLYTKLRQYNLLKSFGDAVFVVLCVLFVLLYARKYNPHLAFNASNVTMVALPIIFALSLARIVLNLGDDTLLSAYAFPAGMVGMLGIILFDAQFALVLVTLSSLLFGVAAEMNFVYILVSIVGGFTAVASLYTIKERKEVLIAGLRLALINFVAVLASGLVMHPEKLDLAAAIGGLVNGFVCYILTLGALPLFEVLFKVATEVRLIELTSTNHPLLRMMEQKAPGSFQHALNVASLAEPAAEAIGANYLLVRAGSYFHDIGKALKPKYYTENQVTPEERRTHSKLSPYMSNLIIKNHVKDGIDLGRKYRLPEKVVDFIAQHQGTGLIKYFYNEALERAEPNDVVHEEEFRYPGPKPQSIEVAIVMLADTVEATATAIFANKTINEDDLRRLVRDAILDKFHDGQFDECHMTFRDLHQISESFVQTLRSRYHHRIEYPTSTPGRREVKDITRTLPPDKAASAIARQA
jgi:putative nucleotidyltransferase with HDIG domain